MAFLLLQNGTDKLLLQNGTDKLLLQEPVGSGNRRRRVLLAGDDENMLAKQSTALTLIVGPILDSTGAEYTGAVIGDLSISKNGGTLTALAAAATLTHIANGQYTLSLTTGNTDTLGVAQITCNKSTYQMPTIQRNIVPANVYDSIVSGSDLLDISVVQLLGTAWLTPGTAGTPDVNVKLLSGDATAADNAEAFFDGTGYAGTNNTIPTVTTATNVTTVNGLAANVITAASIAADAITDAKVASDVTIASVTGAVGSVTGAVGSVTGNVGGNVVGSVGSVTGHTPQTGDSFARIGAAGAGLTALGDTRIANLDATVSSRSTLTQTQVSGGAYAINSASFSFNAAANNAIADSILSRNVSNVEGTAPEHSLCTIILACLEYAVVGTTWTIKRTDGTTTHATKTLTTSASAEPVTEVQ